MVRNGTSSYKIDYVIVIKKFLNPEGHQHPNYVSNLTAILLKGWILPTVGAAWGRVWVWKMSHWPYMVSYGHRILSDGPKKVLGDLWRRSDGFGKKSDGKVLVDLTLILFEIGCFVAFLS